MGKISTISEMDLTGGAACLDFVNTALDYGEPVERLHSYRDLLVLISRLELLDAQTLDALEKLAGQEPEQAEHVMSKARLVRQSMVIVFSALVKGTLERITASALKAFNEHVNEAVDKPRFAVQENTLVLRREAPELALRLAVRVFSRSAFELLTIQDQKLIKQCGACDWFFLDTTKNHRRKWCDMQTCGTHQKARRYYRRKKQG